MLDFWVRVKELLKAQNATQDKIAKQINERADTFSKWIQKDRLPDAEQSYKIAVALGVSVEYLVTGCQSDNKEKIDKIVENLMTSIDDIKNLK